MNAFHKYHVHNMILIIWLLKLANITMIMKLNLQVNLIENDFIKGIWSGKCQSSNLYNTDTFIWVNKSLCLRKWTPWMSFTNQLPCIINSSKLYKRIIFHYMFFNRWSEIHSSRSYLTGFVLEKWGLPSIPCILCFCFSGHKNYLKNVKLECLCMKFLKIYLKS